jgi:hypothetical protein
MAQITQIAKNETKDTVVIYCFCGITRNSSTLANLLVSVVQQVMRILNSVKQKKLEILGDNNKHIQFQCETT